MLLTALTVVHVAISLIGIAAGLVVLFGFFTSKRLVWWNSLFLWTTVATSVTGFFFPFHGITPGIVVGILSLIVLAVAFRARNRWRRTYVIAAMLALYFNVFVLVVQLFEKVPALKALAPTQSEDPFKFAQGLVLGLFVGFTIGAVLKYRPQELS
jgi:hypothetical protein